MLDSSRSRSGSVSLARTSIATDSPGATVALSATACGGAPVSVVVGPALHERSGTATPPPLAVIGGGDEVVLVGLVGTGIGTVEPLKRLVDVDGVGADVVVEFSSGGPDVVGPVSTRVVGTSTPPSIVVSGTVVSGTLVSGAVVVPAAVVVVVVVVVVVDVVVVVVP